VVSGGTLWSVEKHEGMMSKGALAGDSGCESDSLESITHWYCVREGSTGVVWEVVHGVNVSC